MDKDQQKKRARPKTAYETETADKRAMGARMRSARETSGLSLDELAALLGYSQPGKLSLMETGKREPPLKVLLGYTNHCGTTMDFMCGLTEDVDRDPVAAMQLYVERRMNADMKNNLRKLNEFRVEAARALLPGQGEGARMALSMLELWRSIEGMRRINPKFDELRGGATVVSKAELAFQLATQYGKTVDRARRLMQMRVASNDDGEVPQQRIDLLPIDMEKDAT